MTRMPDITVHRLCAPLVVALTLATSPVAHAEGRFYEQHNLVSDGSVMADHVDANLVNGWGVAFNPNGFVWVADNGTGVSTLYDGDGNPQTLVVTIPGGKPTGIVFNSSNDFTVTKGTTKGPSRFIFATENGTISAWAPNVDPTNAILQIPKPDGIPAVYIPAVYKGLALAANGTGNFLYATDFRGGKIDVFDKTFQPASLPGGFSDPNIPRNFAPFGIQNIGGDLYVTYAKQDDTKTDDVAGNGLGFVNVFDADGYLIQRVASRGKLNAPWGLALAPAGFGKFSNRLLVGNFGNGAILAFDFHSGDFVGRLRKPDGHVLKIPGLWGLQFGNGILNQPTGTLFFAAGPDDENHGLYGRIEPAAAGDKPDDDSHEDDAD